MVGLVVLLLENLSLLKQDPKFRGDSLGFLP